MLDEWDGSLFRLKLIKQPDHIDCGLSGFDTFVAPIAPCAGFGLLQRVASQDSHRYWQLEFVSKLRQAMTDFAVDMLIVRRFAFDDTAETDDRGILLLNTQLSGNERNLPSAWNPEHINVLVWNSLIQQRLHCGLVQFSSHHLVVLRNNHCELAKRDISFIGPKFVGHVHLTLVRLLAFSLATEEAA
jgi:hypothetical protein